MTTGGAAHGSGSPLEAPLVRLALFVMGLAVLAGVAALLGRASGIDGDSADTSGEGMAHEPSPDTAAGIGLTDTASGLRLVLTPTAFAVGKPTTLDLRIVDDGRTSITDFDESHDEPPLHLILVRRDLTGYQHLHPVRVGKRFTVDVTLPASGAWRAYADFERDGEKVVLGRDLLVPGSFVPRALPVPVRTAEVDDYAVRLETGSLRAGAESTVEFGITRAGRPVELEPYLGAAGHLVAIREDDLAYLHVHPLESSPASGVAFDAELAEPGRYALFLQFRDEGRVRTVSFTVEVAG